MISWSMLPPPLNRISTITPFLFEYCVIPTLFETFYAITIERHYQHPLVRALLARDEADILAMRVPGRSSRRPR